MNWCIIIEGANGAVLNDFLVQGPADWNHYVAPYLWTLLRAKTPFSVRYEQR